MYENAKKIARAIKNDEFKFCDDYDEDDHINYKIELRKDYGLWVASGFWFVRGTDPTINRIPAFKPPFNFIEKIIIWYWSGLYKKVEKQRKINKKLNNLDNLF